MSPERRRLRARIAGNSHSDSTTDTTGLRAEYKAMSAEEYIKTLVDSAPPLTDDQRRRLAAILTPTGDR